DRNVTGVQTCALPILVGGGTQSALLCQFTANACGCRVSAGPVEATVLGNVALQLMASGDIKSLGEAREIIKRSQDIKIYEPQDRSEERRVGKSWNRVG